MIVDPQVTYFLDTNILVYAYDRTAGEKHTTSAQLLSDCWQYENGCLSIQVLQELFVCLTQKIQSPIDNQSARQIIADLAHWRLHSPEAGDLLKAIDLQRDHWLSFWDAMIVQSAQKLGCQVLVSEDLNHNQVYDTVQVANPFLQAG